MLTTLFSISFTSCIDTDVDPVVEAIYAAQADLIAAQTAVQNAEAGYLAAQAAHEQAMADWTDAQAAQVDVITAGFEADNAQQALVYAQELLLLMAETQQNVAAAQNAMELAQIEFEAELAAAIAAMEEAGIQVAVGYTNDYRKAMSVANSIWTQLLSAQANLANANLMLIDPDGMGPDDDISYAYHLAMLGSAVTVAEANVVDIQANLDLLNSYAADPILALEALEAQVPELRAEYEALKQDEAAQDEVINALIFDRLERNEYESEFWNTLSDYNSAVGQKNNRLTSIENAEDAISDWEDDLADYASELLFLTNAANTAAGAQSTAAGAQTAANTAWVTADADLTTLEGVIAGLEASLQAAATTLAGFQSAYDMGIGTATTNATNAATAVTNAETGVTNAVTDFELWRDRFEAFPNGGYFWEDTTSPSTTLGDTVLGLQTDVTGVAVATYVKIDGYTWNDVALPVGPSAGDTYSPNSIEVAQSLTVNIGDVILPPGGTLTYAQYILSDNVLLVGGVRYFLEVGLDDEVTSNLAGMNAAASVLGNEDQMDVLPVLTDGATGGTDAYSILWDAMLAQVIADDYVLHFGDALAAQQIVYDDLEAIFSDELALLDAAQALEASTAATLSSANTALGLANTALGLANGAVTAFTACDEVCIQNNIDNAESNILVWEDSLLSIQARLDAHLAILTALQPQLTDLGIEFTFEIDAVTGIGTFDVTNDTVGGPSSWVDIRAALIAEYQIAWDIDQAIQIVQDKRTMVNDLISDWNSSYNTFVNTTIPNIEASLVTAMTTVEEAKAALALATNGEAAAIANIEYLEALVLTLEQRYANAIAIADGYKALMDAALGN